MNVHATLVKFHLIFAYRHQFGQRSFSPIALIIGYEKNDNERVNGLDLNITTFDHYSTVHTNIAYERVSFLGCPLTSTNTIEHLVLLYNG